MAVLVSGVESDVNGMDVDSVDEPEVIELEEFHDTTYELEDKDEGADDGITELTVIEGKLDVSDDDWVSDCNTDVDGDGTLTTTVRV